MRRTYLAVAVLALGLSLTACGDDDDDSSAPAPSTPASSSAAPSSDAAPSDSSRDGQDCSGTAAWNLESEDDTRMSPAPLYNVRVSRTDCYDELIFDVNGNDPVGFNVGYVDVVTQDGSGAPVQVEGRGALQVIVRAPAKGYDSSGSQPGVFLAKAGEQLVPSNSLEGYQQLREVLFAGSFEGQSTIAVGVSDQRPFAVDSYVDDDQIAHVRIRIAH